MGIQVEFNPDLALRAFEEFEKGNRHGGECIPENLEKGRTYNFLKKGQRNYWLEGEIPLLETKGGGILSKPLASVIILEATHYYSLEKELWTRGKYKIIEIFDDGRIHFDGFSKVDYSEA